MSNRVLLVGLDPSVVDFADPAYASFPGLDETKLRSALEKDRAALIENGTDARYAFWDKSEASENKFIARICPIAS